MSTGGRGTLRRAVGRWQIVALALNDVIGSGIYLLPAAAVALLGPSSLGAVVLAAVAVGLVVMCFAEAATYFQEPGSAYLYTREAFGDFAGFQVGWMTWLTRVASIASLCAALAQAVAYLWPGAATGLGRAFVVTVPLLILGLINTVGVSSGAWAAVVLTIGKLIPLLVFVAFGALAGSIDTLTGQQVVETGGWGAAALLLLYAFAGFENTAAAAGEFKRPRRDLPFALMVHLAIVAGLYIAVMAVVMSTLPNSGSSQTPLADAAALFLGGWGGLLLTVGAVISIFGTQANTVFAAPRYLLALARDGYGPGRLADVHSRFQTPAVALWATLAVAWPLSLYGSFVGLAALSVLSRLFSYVGTAAAIPVLRRTRTPAPGAFRMPFGPAIPAAAIGLAAVFASGATRQNLISAGVAFGVGVVLFTLRRRRSPDSAP
ncbi:MAG: APC family permease [Acidobacteriota bacterium]